MSIKNIAKQVGVSPATVSRVLNNPEYHCQQAGLREKIWKVAMEQNYVVNEAARNLKKGMSDNKAQYINVLMTRTNQSQPDPFFEELLRVIESEIHVNACILSKVWHQSIFSNDKKCKYADLDHVIEQMYQEVEGKSDGLIIIGKCNKEALKKIKKRFKNVVSVNRNSTNYEVDEVVCDGSKIAAIAVEHLISLGHKNIAYVGACHNESRYRGYLDTLKKHDIDLDPEYIIETKQTEAEGFECMQKFLQSDECPTGIYCANDITAIGMLKCLNRYKNRYYMPSIISSDDIEQAQNTQPMLTTVRLPKEEMGKLALYLLLDRMKGGHKSVIKAEMEATLMERNSCSNVEMSSWTDYYI